MRYDRWAESFWENTRNFYSCMLFYKEEFSITLTKHFKTYLKNKITLLVPGGAGLRL